MAFFCLRALGVQAVSKCVLRVKGVRATRHGTMALEAKLSRQNRGSGTYAASGGFFFRSVYVMLLINVRGRIRRELQHLHHSLAFFFI